VSSKSCPGKFFSVAQELRLRFRDLSLPTDVYGREHDAVEGFETLDAHLLERHHGHGSDQDTRGALAHLHDVLRERIQRVTGRLVAVDLDTAFATMRDLKAALCCLAQRAVVYFWMGRREMPDMPGADSFSELYTSYLQAFFDTFIDVSASEKEAQNRRYTSIMLDSAGSDPLLRRLGRTVVNDISSSLVHDVPDAALSERIWNELTTAYYAGESRFDINISTSMPRRTSWPIRLSRDSFAWPRADRFACWSPGQGQGICFSVSSIVCTKPSTTDD
jgi:hypothetical protein